jgi:hypothetical protein
MDQVVLTRGVREYYFVSRPTDSQIDILCARAGLELGLELGTQSDNVLLGSQTEMYGCWWSGEIGCSGWVGCTCGPVTLLEVLGEVGAEDRQVALGIHSAHLRDLYRHYWSVQSAAANPESGSSGECASCILDTTAHVGALERATTELGVELAEALCAYYCQISLGEPLYS